MLCPAENRPRNLRWSADRAARLGFLIGLGFDARDVARDPGIASTPDNVRQQAKRLGLAFRAACGHRLPFAILARYEAAATRRGVTSEDLINRLILNAGSDDDLIDNILDDQS